MPRIIPEDWVREHEKTVHRDFSHSRYDAGLGSFERFHSGTVLNHLLRTAGLQTPLSDVLSRLRRHLGEDETIWGVKFRDGAVASVELYISNRDEPSPVTLRTYETLQRVLHPWLDAFVSPPPLCPYTMVSFEFDHSSAQRTRAANANFYVSSHVRAIAKDGYAYELGADAVLLRNHYRHFTLSETEELRNRLRFSPRIVGLKDVDRLLPEGCHGCRSVSYAAKPASDGLYFRRLTHDHSIRFANTYGLGNVGQILETYAAELRHLSWDVGYDFGRTLGRQEAPLFGKAAIYGLW